MSVNFVMGINDYDMFIGFVLLYKVVVDGDFEKVIVLFDDGVDGNIRVCGEVCLK